MSPEQAYIFEGVQITITGSREWTQGNQPVVRDLGLFTSEADQTSCLQERVCVIQIKGTTWQLCAAPP